MRRTARAPVPSVYVLDSDPVRRRLVARWAEGAGHAVVERADFPAVGSFDCLAIVVGVSGRVPESLTFLREVSQANPSASVVASVGSETALVPEALRVGAHDFLAYPLDRLRVGVSIDRALERAAMLRGRDAPRELHLGRLEAWAIERALTLTEGCVADAARLLGIGRATLYRKLQERNGPPSSRRAASGRRRTAAA